MMVLRLQFGRLQHVDINVLYCFALFFGVVNGLLGREQRSVH